MIAPLMLKNLIDVMPRPVLIFAAGGRCLYGNRAACDRLGETGETLQGAKIGRFFAGDADEVLSAPARGGREPGAPVRRRLRLARAESGMREVEAECSWLDGGDAEPCLMVMLTDPGDRSAERRELEEKYEKLRMIVDDSATPLWGMEFPEPVDLNASDREIIRQIFQNESYWSMCNKAMANLYNLPDDLDFNKQPVRHYFPRSPENESFMQEVIDHNFSIDDALSVDVSHDGSTIYVANTVRAHIKNNLLYRMWGEARDVTVAKRDYNELAQKERDLNDILSAVGDVIFVLDEKGALQAANPAFEEVLGWSVSDLLGKKIDPVLNFAEDFASRHKVKPGKHLRITISAVNTDQGPKDFDVTLSCFTDDSNRKLFVGVMRESAGTPPSCTRN